MIRVLDNAHDVAVNVRYSSATPNNEFVSLRRKPLYYTRSSPVPQPVQAPGNTIPAVKNNNYVKSSPTKRCCCWIYFSTPPVIDPASFKAAADVRAEAGRKGGAPFGPGKVERLKGGDNNNQVVTTNLWPPEARKRVQRKDLKRDTPTQYKS